MDNQLQLEEILKYREQLSQLTGCSITIEIAAHVWVQQYAQIWRLKHPRISQHNSQ